MKKTWVVFISICILIILVCIYFGFKFKSVNIEIGDKLPKSDSFIRYGIKNGITVDFKNVNVNKVGSYFVKLKYAFVNLNLKVNVKDTKSPLLECQNIYKPLDYEFKIDDFVTKVEDSSEYTLFYDGNFDVKAYGEYPLTIIAKDEYGNKSECLTNLFISWTKTSYQIEMGNILKREDLVFNKNDIGTINQKDIDLINDGAEGKYIVTSIKDNIRRDIHILKTEDKTPPTLILKKVTIYKDRKINSINDFVNKAYDKVSKVTLKLLTTINYNKIGEQEIKIEASDAKGNKVVGKTVLNIIRDTQGPKIQGLSKITVNKNTLIDYKKGVSAYDDNFGASTFTVDSSNVDVSKYGTYYAVYISTDKLGNTTNAKRIISVNHDKDDTNALVKSIASTLSSDLLSLRNYSRNTIGYIHNSGGGDPVWYGLTNKRGDCIVHAYVLDALLKEKGYTTKVIWVTDKSHYWNLVYYNGKWVHIDSTPGTRHTKYDIMNDNKRYETLQGRDWDRSLWPKAE